MSAVAEGLEGIVVTKTRLSDVDGDAGRLVIAGRSVEQLAGEHAFEAVWHLLRTGRLPSQAELAAERASLGQARADAWSFVERAGSCLDREDGMDALRALVATMPGSLTPTLAEGTAMVGAMAVFAGAFAARRSGLAQVAPDPSLSHAADYWRMVRGGELPSSEAAAALDAYLVTVTDHGMNASTFAARVVASTGSDLTSAIVAGIGALKGPLHGGAPGPVLDMLDGIGSEDRAEAWLAAELDAGRRIMGMGHRVYRVRDPRAAVLERALAVLEANRTSANARLGLARAVERAAAALLARKYPARSLQANVEFYTAVLLDAVGIPRWCFSPTFAVGRVAGWCAHVAEQRERGRLIRPSSLYDGPAVSPA